MFSVLFFTLTLLKNICNIFVREMERVTTYLKVTAKKEIEARSSLETIISGLISRAAKAEADVQHAKSCQVPHFTKVM